MDAIDDAWNDPGQSPEGNADAAAQAALSYTGDIIPESWEDSIATAGAAVADAAEAGEVAAGAAAAGAATAGGSTDAPIDGDIPMPAHPLPASDAATQSLKDAQTAEIERISAMGRLIFYPQSDMPLDLWRFQTLYHDLTIDDPDLPAVESVSGATGVTKGPKGMVMHYDTAKLIATKYPTLDMDVEGTTIKIKLTARRLVEEDSMSTLPPSAYATGPSYRSLMDEKGAYILVKLRENEELLAVTAADVRKALERIGAAPKRCQRGQVKIPRDEVDTGSSKNWAPLGPSAVREYISADIIPPSGFSIFSDMILLPVHSASTGKDYNLRFLLGGPNVKPLCAFYEGCRRRREDCTCVPYVPDSRKRRAPPPERPMSKANREAEGIALLFSKSAKHAESLCPNLHLGRCSRGTKCKFMHSHITPENLAKIECRVNKSRITGVCDAAPHCVYAACVAKQAEFAAEMGICMEAPT